MFSRLIVRAACLGLGALLPLMTAGAQAQMPPPPPGQPPAQPTSLPATTAPAPKVVTVPGKGAQNSSTTTGSPRTEISGAEFLGDSLYPEVAPYRGDGFPAQEHFKTVLDFFKSQSLLGGLDSSTVDSWHTDWLKRYPDAASLSGEDEADKACEEALKDLHDRFEKWLDKKLGTTGTAGTPPTGTSGAPLTAVAGEIEMSGDPRLQRLLLWQVRRFDMYMRPKGKAAHPAAKPVSGPGSKPAAPPAVPAVPVGPRVGVGIVYHIRAESELIKAHLGIPWLEYENKFRRISTGHEIFIREVIEGGPAAKAGVPDHCLLTHIDGKEVAGKLVKEAHALLLGAPGTSVELTVVPTDKTGKPGTPKKFKVERVPYRMSKAHYKDLGDDVAYIRIDDFSEAEGGGRSVVDDFKERLNRVVAEKKRKLVIDLRGNPGGRVDFCQRMLEWVLPSGYGFTQLERKGTSLARSTVIFTREVTFTTRPSGRPGSNEVDYNARELIIPESMPIVVMADGGTASCGELFSLALKYNKRAEFVGMRTWGKGITQAVTEINGREVHVTNSFFHPGDVFTNAIGGVPDLKVEPKPGDEDVQLDAAVKRVREMYAATLAATAARQAEIDQAVKDNNAEWLGIGKDTPKDGNASKP